MNDLRPHQPTHEELIAAAHEAELKADAAKPPPVRPPHFPPLPGDKHKRKPGGAMEDPVTAG